MTVHMMTVAFAMTAATMAFADGDVRQLNGEMRDRIATALGVLVLVGLGVASILFALANPELIAATYE